MGNALQLCKRIDLGVAAVQDQVDAADAAGQAAGQPIDFFQRFADLRIADVVLEGEADAAASECMSSPAPVSSSTRSISELM